jgi:hypothetical protein
MALPFALVNIGDVAKPAEAAKATEAVVWI